MPDQTDASTAPKSIDNADKSMDDIMALCKRRGFIYQASEIYGGINGFWDYGPLGAQLKKNLRDAWWEDVIMMGCSGATGPDGEPVEIVPLDTCIIQNPKVWEASGHIGGFNDPMVEDQDSKKRFRADHLFGLYLTPATSEKFETDYELLQGHIDDTSREIPFFPNLTCIANNAEEALGHFKSIEKKLKSEIRIVDGDFA